MNQMSAISDAKESWWRDGELSGAGWIGGLLCHAIAEVDLLLASRRDDRSVLVSRFIEIARAVVAHSLA